MKKILPVLFIALIGAVSSCKEMNDNDGKTQIVQDSLIRIFPTWQALTIKVEDNRSRMNIIMGDVAFYNASPEVKARKARDLGNMILRIYGKDNYLEKGDLIVTKDIHNNSETPADGISIPIDFKGMKGDGK